MSSRKLETFLAYILVKELWNEQTWFLGELCWKDGWTFYEQFPAAVSFIPESGQQVSLSQVQSKRVASSIGALKGNGKWQSHFNFWRDYIFFTRPINEVSYQRHGNSVHKRFAYKKQAFHVCLIESSFFISSFQKEVGHFFLKGAWFCFFRKFLYHIALSCSQRVVFFLLKWKWLLLNNM